ncbi:hypothetical protein Vafri_3127 [Volvox africanus]|uniref:Uncharacterized protein n=1 Tax=Volvox africanus TaxID=51714 RepID=A0A8J4AR43_9CHLO|nr:hypothetical protein Vafri_3127 [Volvox africanus]
MVTRPSYPFNNASYLKIIMLAGATTSQDIAQFLASIRMLYHPVGMRMSTGHRMGTTPRWAGKSSATSQPLLSTYLRHVKMHHQVHRRNIETASCHISGHQAVVLAVAEQAQSLAWEE